MDFIFNGFHQELNVRHFAFQGIASDRTHTEFTVGADLLLARKYQIALQDLPLLCRRLLEELAAEGVNHAVIFTEDNMRLHAKNREAARDLAASRRKPARRPSGAGVGSAWRGPQPVS